MDKLNLSTNEAADYLAGLGTPFTKGTLEVWRCHKQGPVYRKIGHKVFYRREDLDAFSNGEVVLTSVSAA